MEFVDLDHWRILMFLTFDRWTFWSYLWSDPSFQKSVTLLDTRHPVVVQLQHGRDHGCFRSTPERIPVSFAKQLNSGPSGLYGYLYCRIFTVVQGFNGLTVQCDLDARGPVITQAGIGYLYIYLEEQISVIGFNLVFSSNTNS